MVVDHHNMSNRVKGRSIRKVENHGVDRRLGSEELLSPLQTYNILMSKEGKEQPQASQERMKSTSHLRRGSRRNLHYTQPLNLPRRCQLATDSETRCLTTHTESPHSSPVPRMQSWMRPTPAGKSSCLARPVPSGAPFSVEPKGAGTMGPT